MTSPIIQYDISNYYDEILNNIIYKRNQIRQYLIQTPDEPSCNQKLTPLIQNTRNKIWNVILQIIFVQECFKYELSQYDSRETDLTPDEKLDKEAINCYYWQLFNITSSFRQTNQYLKGLEQRLYKYQFSETSHVKQAITHACNKHNKRIKHILNYVLPDYILKCILRPYYIKLRNSGTSLTDAFKGYYDETNFKIVDFITQTKPLIEEVTKMAYAKPIHNWQEVRLDEWKQGKIQSDQRKEIRKIAKEQKYVENAKQRLAKYCMRIEQTIQKRHNIGQNDTLGFTSKVLTHPDYNKNCKSVSIIAILYKPPKGNSSIVFLNKNDTTTRIKDVNNFYFNEVPQNIIDHCYTIENIKAVDTIKIY